MSILSSVIKKTLRTLQHKGEMRHELKRVIDRFPALAGLPEASSISWRLLTEPYEEYVAGVSSPVWAVSPQTAALVHGLCTLLKPKMVLDLGSGFSSFALRRYSRDATDPCTVHSIDDDVQWLKQTWEFLVAHGLQTDGMFLWDAFQERAAPHYDLILHDMGRMNVRLETLPRVLDLTATDGLVVLDDMHKPEYAPEAIERCRGAGFEVCGLRAMTLDVMGRYAAVSFRPRRR